MKAMLLFYIVLCLVLNLMFVDAFTVSTVHVTRVDSDHDVWKPSGAVTLGDGVSCARAQQENCKSCLNESTAICTFDGGKSFIPQQTQYPFCGDRGVLIDSELHCPLRLHQVDHRTINVSVVSYGGVEKLSESVHNTSMLSFVYWDEDEIVDILFKGNTIIVPEEGVFLMNAVVIKSDSSSQHTLFRSVDGWNWKAWSKIPLSLIDKGAISREGLRLVTVSTFSDNTHETVSSGYLGKWWRSVKAVNTTTPPVSLFFPSGVVMGNSLLNGSGLVLHGFIEGKPKKKSYVHLIDLYKEGIESNDLPDDILSNCEEGSPCKTSSYVSLSVTGENQIVALFDFVSKTTQRKTIGCITIKLDDSEEKQKILEEERKIQENERIREEARIKLKKESEERKRAERANKRKKELQKKEKFLTADISNIEMAKVKLKEDGEFVVIRDVLEENIDLEKKTFFW